MKITKTIYNTNLMSPDSIDVVCGEHSRTFDVKDKQEIGKWLLEIWNDEFFPTPAYVYYNINWDRDHVYYCKYEAEF